MISPIIDIEMSMSITDGILNNTILKFNSSVIVTLLSELVQIHVATQMNVTYDIMNITILVC